MGRTLTEVKLADQVRFVAERYRDPESGQLDIRLSVQCAAVTNDGEVVRNYNFVDLFNNLPPARATAWRTAVSGLISDMAARLGVADS